LSQAKIVEVRWGDGYVATRTSPDAPLARAFVGTLSDAGIPAVVSPAGGGSLPTHVFSEILRAPLVFVAMANHDNNQHAANENVRIGNLWSGIELYAATMSGLGRTWR